MCKKYTNDRQKKGGPMEANFFELACDDFIFLHYCDNMLYIYP